jgi:hypothetical protein
MKMTFRRILSKRGLAGGGHDKDVRLLLQPPPVQCQCNCGVFWGVQPEETDQLLMRALEEHFYPMAEMHPN